MFPVPKQTNKIGKHFPMIPIKKPKTYFLQRKTSSITANAEIICLLDVSHTYKGLVLNSDLIFTHVRSKNSSRMNQDPQ